MESKEVLIYIVGSKLHNMNSKESMHKKFKNNKVCFYCGIKSKLDMIVLRRMEMKIMMLKLFHKYIDICKLNLFIISLFKVVKNQCEVPKLC